MYINKTVQEELHSQTLQEHLSFEHLVLPMDIVQSLCRESHL